MDDERTAVAWLHRRAGFGLHPDELDNAVARGVDTEMFRLTTSERIGDPPDPWSDIEFDPDDPGTGRRQAIAGWFEHLVATERPHADRLTWVLHGWLVSSLQKVVRPELMVRQIGLFMRSGGGDFADLLREITVDPAMLVYLDGRTSTGGSPNENYGRELLELFSLGVGNYTEDDVRAASRALTGWVVEPSSGDVFLAPRRHDDSPQTLLGVDGVRDVDTVVEAIVTHPAHARFVAERIAREYLGDPADPVLDGVVDDLAAAYEAGGRRLDTTVIRALELGLDGATTPLVVAPVPWVVNAMRSCGVRLIDLGPDTARRVPELGQVPMLPPNVAGWPSGQAWFAAGSLIARANVAAAIAAGTARSEPVWTSADDGDDDALARQLGLTEPFGPSTRAALRAATAPVDRLTLALISPENLLS